MPNRSSEKPPRNPQSTQLSTPRTAADSSVRHVGRTLESDPEYYDQPSRELAPAAALISRSGNDLTATPDMRDGSERLPYTHIIGGSGQESLKTRLPGDTSSDPHTDLEPDNANAVQLRRERKK